MFQVVMVQTNDQSVVYVPCEVVTEGAASPVLLFNLPSNKRHISTGGVEFWNRTNRYLLGNY